MFRPTTAAVTLCLALGLAGAACAQDEIVSTRPATIRESDVPPPPPPPPPPRSQLDPGVQAYIDEWASTAPAEPAYARSNRVFVSDTPAAPEPLPAWALEEPVRYVAEMCRPRVRPAGEEIEACFTRVEHEVNEARRAGRTGPSDPVTRRECRTETYRSQDGSETSSTYTCTVGNGDPELLNDLLNGD